MRRYARLWLVLLLLLSGCGGPAAPSREAEPDAARAPEAGLSATQLESEARPLTEEEILSAYYRAEEAYGWFDLTPLPDTGETVRVEGAVYRRVDYPGMESADDLRTYLRSLFSAELTEQMLAMGGARPLYRDVDGILYVSFPGRDRDSGKGAVQAEVVQVDSQTYSLEVSVEVLDGGQGGVTGLECWSFPYAYVDGRWVFTDFCLVS